MMENTELDTEKEEILDESPALQEAAQADMPLSEEFPPEAEEAEPITEIPTPDTDRKPGKKIILLAAAAAAVVVLLLICIFSFSGGSLAEYPAAIYYQTDTGKETYLTTHNGRSIPLNIEKEDIKTAVLTPDDKHVLVILEDGQLYITDSDMESKTTICDHADSLMYVRSEGFVYCDADKQYYRILFKNTESLPLGEKINSMACADNALVLLYCANDQMYTLTASQKEPQSVFEPDSSENIECIAVTENAELGAWIESKSKLHFLDHGQVETVEARHAIKYPISFTTKDSRMFYIFDLDVSTIWMKKAGKEAVEARLPDTLRSVPYTISGFLSNEKAASVKDLYVSVDGGNVYCISPSGDRERVLSDIASFFVSDGRIVYLEESHDLYAADLDHFQVSDPEKIATEVQNVAAGPDGKYLFYTKQQEEDGLSLYCCSMNDLKSERISREISPYWSIANDGRTILFYKDPESIPDSYKDCGTLMSWSVGDKEARKIATEVVIGSLQDYTISDYLRLDSLYFDKYISSLGDGDYEADFMFFNGKDAEKVLPSVAR